MQEKLLVLSHVLGSGAIACDRIWPTVREATTRNMTSSYQSSFTEKYKGLVGKKSCFVQSDRLTQWQSMTHENTFWKLIFSSPLADMADDLALTVANPQSTLLIFSMDSTASLPSSSSVGSLVARYKYIALSISSAKHPNICQHKPYTQGRWAIPWTNLKILQHDQVNSLACLVFPLAPSTDLLFLRMCYKEIPSNQPAEAQVRVTNAPSHIQQVGEEQETKRLILSCQS